ncbi:MAG: carbohydrate-binding domain-containing protein [Bacillota bacterium]
MKKNIMQLTVATLLISSVVGCGSNEQSVETVAEPSVEVAAEAVADTVMPTSANLPSYMTTDLFTEKDFVTTYEAHSTITLADGATTSDDESVSVEGDIVTITQGGAYVLTGVLSDGQILVDCADTDEVHLIFDNVDIKNEMMSAVLINGAGHVHITLNDGTSNVISSVISMITSFESGAISSSSPLTINGTGALEINAVDGSGIVGLDDITIISGDYEIVAGTNGIDTFGALKIADANMYVQTNYYGFYIGDMDNTADPSVGFVHIVDGNYSLQTANAAIFASNYIAIENGTLDVYTGQDGFYTAHSVYLGAPSVSMETVACGIFAAENTTIEDANLDIQNVVCAIDSQTIDINGGTTNITAHNEALYANASDVSKEAYINITGGMLMMNGNFLTNGLNSSGEITISGGEILSSSMSAYDFSPNSPLADSLLGNTASVTGGTLLVTGSLGMQVQNFDTNSTQSTIFIILEEPQEGVFTLTDSAGATHAEMTTPKPYQTILISLPTLEIGEEYTLTTPTETRTILLEELVYIDAMLPPAREEGELPEGQMPMGERPEGEMPMGELPEGQMPMGERPEGEMPMGGQPQGGQPPQ